MLVGPLLLPPDRDHPGGVLPVGTVASSILRWSGTAWVEETEILALANGGQTWNSASPVLLIGSGAGGPFVQIDKADASASFLDWKNAGVIRWRVQHTNTERWDLDAYTAAGAYDGTPISVSGKDAMSLLETVSGLLTIKGGLDAAREVRGQHLKADGDPGGGTASTTTVTNITDGVGAGAVTLVQATTALNVTNAGWIGLYVGTTLGFVPYFTRSP